MRYKELDSLRGLASLSVLIGHFLLVFPAIEKESGSRLINLLKYSPLHIFWAGHEAVIFFFVLSGFVLSLPFHNGKVNYFAFVTKRICRIYFPYVLSVIVGVVASSAFYKNPEVMGLSDWFNTIWKSPFSSNELIKHFVMVGSFNHRTFNPVIWTLVYEMRISLIFPFLMFFVLRFNWKSLFVGVTLSAGSYIILNKYPPEFFSGSFIRTFHFTTMFIIGALLAQHRKLLVNLCLKLNNVGKLMLLTGGMLAYTYSWSFSTYHNWLVDDLVIAFGASIFMILALATNNFLTHNVSVFLGKISYSLYLWHIIVLTISIQLLHGRFDLWLILIVAFATTIVVSTVSYRFIEMPSTQLGKKLVLQNTTIFRRRSQSA